MKKILHTTVLFAFIFLSLNANAKSKLSISTTMPTAMKVVIDGHKFYSQENSLTINNLQPGYHDISIYYIKNGRDFNNFYNNGSNGYWKKAISRQVVVRNNYQYDITINRFGKAFFDQDYYNSNNNWDDEDDYNTNNYNNNNYYDYNDNNGYNENYNDWDYFRKNNDGKNNNQNINPIRNNNYLPAMNSNLFNQVKQTMQETAFESSKLEFAKQSLDKNSITTNQAKEMIAMFTMEMDKLDFAKYAYDKVSDKANYFTIANSLSMQMNKDDLLKYIRDKK